MADNDSKNLVTAMGVLFGRIVSSAGAVFLSVILSAFLGGVAGWIVGLFFSDMILNILGQLGVHNVSMFQFGVFMGFVGGFLRTKVANSAK